MIDIRRCARWMELAKPTAASLSAFLALALPSQGLTAVQQVDAVTFTRDVAPILQENCEVCHQPGSIGPMVLRSYEEVRAWAPIIKDRVENRLMPPWPIDRTVGLQEFKNDVSLSDQEIATIVRWVEAGAPMGDPAAMPPPIEWPEYTGLWLLEPRFGKPDIVVTTEDYTVRATGLDQWPNSDVPIEGIAEERWIRAVEVRPSNPDAAYVFHHGNSSLRQRNDEDDDQNTGLIAATVGKMYDILPEDAGIRLLPGATMRTALHYFPIGEVVENATLDVGIYLYPPGERPRFETRGSTLMHGDITQERVGPWNKISSVDAGGVRAVDIVIPPHSTLTMKGTWVVQEPTRIHSLRGHMHLRGLYQVVEVVYPDGRHEVLNKLDWQHRWHTDFLYEDHVMPLLPRGTMVIITSHFDNTANNPSNPDPDQLVVFGQRTADEMAHVWIGRTFFSEEEFEELVAERERLLREGASVTMLEDAQRANDD